MIMELGSNSCIEYRKISRR